MSKHHENRIVGAGPSKQAGARGEEYWTEQRRAEAKPLPLPIERPKEAAPAAPAIERGEPGHLQPGRPSEETRAKGAGTESDASAVLNPLVYPYSTCGKLFFTQNGGNFTGSAAMVAPNVLLTAGHCVFNGGWSTNVAFYPSYPPPS